MPKKRPYKAESPLNMRIKRAILSAMTPYIGGWIDTLGKTGSPDGKGPAVPGSTRVTAAKTGIDLLQKCLVGDIPAEGLGLLQELEKVERAALRAEGGGGVQDPSAGGEENDLEEG